MKLALINPDRISVDPPLGIAYIASYLRKYGNFDDIVIIDKEDPIKAVRKEKPDVVGISATTSDFPEANRIAKEIKESFEVPLIIGGHHISLMSQHLPLSNFDMAVLGEGEQTMLELMQSYEKNRGFQPEKLKEINGLAFLDNDNLKMTQSRKPIEPLDLIPYPARDLLKMEKYYLLPRKSFFPGKLVVTTGIITSRGCPYKCVFCSSSAFWPIRVRFHSPEYVVGEVKMIVEKYKVDHMEIWDDLFNVNKKRIERIGQLMKEEGLKDKVNFVVNGRANLIDREMCKLLKDMNVVRISLGLESGSERILKYLKKGMVSVKDNRRAIRLCKQFGIETNGFFIIGSPPETEEDLKDTLSLVRDENLDTFSIFQLAPFPGTEIWKYALEKDIVSENINFNYKQLAIPTFKPDLIMTENISEEKFKEWYNLFQEEVAKKYYKKIKFELKHLKYLFNSRFLWRIFTHPNEVINYLRHARS